MTGESTPCQLSAAAMTAVRAGRSGKSGDTGASFAQRGLQRLAHRDCEGKQVWGTQVQGSLTDSCQRRRAPRLHPEGCLAPLPAQPAPLLPYGHRRNHQDFRRQQILQTLALLTCSCFSLHTFY